MANRSVMLSRSLRPAYGGLQLAASRRSFEDSLLGAKPLVARLCSCEAHVSGHHALDARGGMNEERPLVIDRRRRTREGAVRKPDLDALAHEPATAAPLVHRAPALVRALEAIELGRQAREEGEPIDVVAGHRERGGD